MRAPQRHVAVIGAATATTVVATTVASLLAEPLVGRHIVPPPFESGWLQLLLVTAGVVCVIGSWLTLPQPGIPVGLALVLIGWLLPLGATWDSVPDRVRAALLGGPPVTLAGVALVVLASRSSHADIVRRALQTAIVLALAAAAIHVLGYNPFDDPNCRELCAEVPAALDGIATTPQSLNAASALTLIGSVICVVVIAVARPAPLIVLASGTITLVASSMTSISSTLSWDDATHSLVQLILTIGVGCFGGSITATALATWHTRRLVEGLVRSLSAFPETLANPGRHIEGVLFAIPGEDRWIDVNGLDAPSAQPDGRWLVLRDGDTPTARLRLARQADQDAVLAALTPATRLALSNVYLTALARSRLIEVQASQRRIVATSDQERRRIERDLHDGAQQRLVSIAFHLSAARSRLDADAAASLSPAEEAVRDALAGLRRLSHGIFPSALAEEGFAAALEDTIAASDVAVTVDLKLGKQPELVVAMAIYATVVEILQVARPDTQVRIHIGSAASELRVRATASPVDVLANDSFDDVSDRVGALGGTLTVHPLEPDGIEVMAVIPCESS